MKSLHESINDYLNQNTYPFHMPGHKRKPLPWLNQVNGRDLTEVAELDNLSSSDGIILSSLQRAAKIYNTAKTFYSVNGSTGVILAAIYSATTPGDTILVARNCHKSVFNAVELLQLHPIVINPEFIEDFNIFGSITAEAVEKALADGAKPALAVITSPTYEGIVSDVGRIANVLHKAGVPLLVDEAHGAHFSFLPKHDSTAGLKSAVMCGADMVVQSLHKTLPSLNQTALLHVCNNMVNFDKVAHAMTMFQTSSPAYFLLESIDSCINQMFNCPGNFSQLYRNMSEFYSTAKCFKNLRIYNSPTHDRSKILINTSKCNCTGAELELWLLKNSKIQIEYALGQNALAIATVCDEKEDLERLLCALQEFDAQCNPTNCNAQGSANANLAEIFKTPSEVVTPPALAMRAKHVFLPITQCIGRIAAEYIWFYPPGVPIIIPGQIITAEITGFAQNMLAAGQKWHKTFVNEDVAVLK
ncbi:MAG: aminotransferase class V-fold PLP-dependent enzyme [Oscillospiraceae bacterium]|jgi:arginine/lysine/ornithine decarboxylase|nr:aminotransferase class V-fold PLP-dependent enzyme [Oscillospiraceae bacterium]